MSDRKYSVLFVACDILDPASEHVFAIQYFRSSIP